MHDTNARMYLCDFVSMGVLTKFQCADGFISGISTKIFFARVFCGRRALGTGEHEKAAGLLL